MQLSHQDKVLLNKGLVLFELSNENVDNIPVFAFIMVDKNDVMRLQRDLNIKTSINYNDYGRLVFADVGVPSQADRTYAEELARKMLETN